MLPELQAHSDFILSKQVLTRQVIADKTLNYMNV